MILSGCVLWPVLKYVHGSTTINSKTYDVILRKNRIHKWSPQKTSNLLGSYVPDIKWLCFVIMSFKWSLMLSIYDISKCRSGIPPDQNKPAYIITTYQELIWLLLCKCELCLIVICLFFSIKLRNIFSFMCYHIHTQHVHSMTVCYQS